MGIAWLLCVGAWVGTVQGPAIVEGVVSDARTKAALPRYLLELQGGTRFDRITSDDRGRFSSAIVFPQGDVVVRCVDDDAVTRSVMQGGLLVSEMAETSRTVRFEGQGLEIAVPVGPTFRMAWKGEQPAGSPTTAATSSAEIVWKPAEVLDPEVTLRAGVRIESDGRAWVRFAPLPVSIPSGSARLRVLSVDGFWMSEAPVEVEKAAGELDLVWRPCARWTGVLKDTNSRGVGGTWVRLERFDEKGGIRERRRTRCDGSGKYAFHALDEGRWKLSGDPLRFVPFQSEVREVVGGEVSKLSIVLESAREVAPINGRIEGAVAKDGEPAPSEPVVVVRRAGEPLPQETLRAGWKNENGRYVALFIVPRLPLGDYDLELVPAGNDAGAWGALAQRAKAGGTVVFTHR